MSHTVYFLGAGASAADGLPVTNDLNFGVAAWLRNGRDKAVELLTYLSVQEATYDRKSPLTHQFISALGPQNTAEIEMSGFAGWAGHATARSSA